MKTLFFCSLFLFSIQSYSQEIPKSSATDRFSSYQLFKGNRMLSSVSFAGGWGGLQGFVGGVNARQMFSMPNGRLFMGVQGEYNASGRFYNSYSAGVVGRYYIFNSNQWSAFAQSSFNVGRANYSNGGVQFFGGGVFNINTQAATSNFYSMEAGIGIQRRITKRLALEMLIDKPFILQQRNTKITSPYFSNLGTNFKPVAPQFKFGINYFFGK